MHTTPELPELLKLIEDRSSAFRAAVQAAPDLDAEVAGCPGWTLTVLARHLGGVQRRWSGIVAAGPADAPPPGTWQTAAESAPEEREALLDWLAESTRQLVDTLREAGPDRGCWTWWGDTQSPETSGAVARHQVQEAAVHTYDAQLAGGVAQPPALPEEVAVDGVEEFSTTCGTTETPWPHEPATVDVHITEGYSWRLTLSADGSSVRQLSDADAGSAATAFMRGTASDVILVSYDRIPLDTLELGGDVSVVERLRTWEF
ncbi:maleylpyruvate isomerase N-terminal domain-containing protein [Catenulispora rubra]|uniref:maleylpyruvate isomerase N-terminal domain-containing protein n=1 Tax=Catenulispora rubra TaxID=280293 RepID=UPI00189286C6|nr:maleylpyruvate isomerase N-terminal domain-containing protein [Catenulispora rubra]